MKFTVELDQDPLDGVLRYLDADYAFTFDAGSPEEVLERTGSNGITSLSVGTLQIEVGVETGVALFVWGLHPRATWQYRQLGAPAFVPGGVRVDAAETLRRGVSVQIAAVATWATWFDNETGWVRIAADPVSSSDQEVLVATGVVLGLSENQLDSLWLQPVFD